MRKTTGTLLFCLLLCINGIPGAKADSPKIDATEKVMRSFVDAGEISGSVTLVADRKQTLHHSAVGKQDLDSGKPMTLDSRFAIASMTKPITATAVMLLVERGKLDLDATVESFIPEFKTVQLKNGKSPKRPLTIKDCLTHTAGLAGSQVFEGSLEDAAKEIASRRLAFQPGNRWQYSPGVTVAGRIVEVVSQMPFQDFLEKEIFETLGMNETSFYLSEDEASFLATLYRRPNGKSLAPSKHKYLARNEARGPNPSAGLVSTARDLEKFYRCILNLGKHADGRLLSEASVKEMVRVHTGDKKAGFVPGTGWGLGWAVVRKPQGVTEMLSVGTFGHGGAYGTQGWVDPVAGKIYILMIQRADLKNSDASDIRKQFQASANPT